MLHVFHAVLYNSVEGILLDFFSSTSVSSMRPVYGCLASLFGGMTSQHSWLHLLIAYNGCQVNCIERDCPDGSVHSIRIVAREIPYYISGRVLRQFNVTCLMK